MIRGLPKKLIQGLLAVGVCLFMPVQLEARSVSSPQLVTLQLRWFHQFQFAGYYLAKELGYYDALGISVEFLEGKPGISPIEEVISGRAHFGVDNSGLVSSRSMGDPVKVVAAIFQKSALRFVLLGEDEVTPQALIGKSVMLLPDYGSIALISFLKQQNLLDKIVRVDSSHDINDLIGGTVFAFNGYASNEPYTLETQGIPFTLIDPSNYGVKFYSDVLFTSDDLSLRDPELVDDFKAATIEGWNYVLEYPEKAIEIVKRYAPEKSKSHLRFEANIVRQHMLSDIVEIGHMNYNRWVAIQNQLVDIGLIPEDQTIDINDLIHTPYAERSSWKNYIVYISVLAVPMTVLTVVSSVFYRRSRKLEQEVVESKAAEAKLFKVATHDPLTKLPNRLLFQDRLKVALQDTNRTGINSVVAFIDLDDFKQVNDHYGHQHGDQLLKLATANMKAEIRASATLARYGGDEFLYLARDMNPDQCEKVALRLIDAIRQASQELDLNYEITATIGMVIINNADAVSAEDIIDKADLSMYSGKSGEKGSVTIDVLE